MDKPNVAICMPVASKIDQRTLASLVTLDKGDAAAVHTMLLTGFKVEVARNAITFDAVNYRGQDGHRIDYLLWIDSDMVFPPHALKRLLAHAAAGNDVVGGLCFDRHHPHKPVAARFYDASWGYEPGTIGWLWDYPRESLIEVDRTGGAFLLVKREVFEKIREREVPAQTQDQKATAAYKDWWNPIPEECHAEDLSFCARVQAAGFKIHVDTGLAIGHVGEVVIDAEFSARNRQYEYHRWLPPLVQLVDAAAVYPMREAPVPAGSAAPPAPPLDLSLPVASVVIPTYDTEPRYLLAAIRSALAQTLPVEVIVVDDGSKQPVTLRWANEQVPVMRPGFSVQVVRHDANRGISAALNSGIERMRTEWFAWLSADDTFEPEKIEMQLAALAALRLKCCYTSYDTWADRHRAVKHGRLAVWNNLEEQHACLSRACCINGSTVLIHKSVLDAVGKFDESFQYGQDWDMWCRIGARYLWHAIPDKLVMRREFDNLTMAIALSPADDPRRAQRDLEDARIRRMYSARPCPHCGGILA